MFHNDWIGRSVAGSCPRAAGHLLPHWRVLIHWSDGVNGIACLSTLIFTQPSGIWMCNSFGFRLTCPTYALVVHMQSLQLSALNFLLEKKIRVSGLWLLSFIQNPLNHIQKWHFLKINIYKAYQCLCLYQSDESELLSRCEATSFWCLEWFA